jgi:CrcB protein
MFWSERTPPGLVITRIVADPWAVPLQGPWDGKGMSKAMNSPPPPLTTCSECDTSALYVADTHEAEHIANVPGEAPAVSEVRRVVYLLIGIGGFLGANARYLVAGWITERLGAAFPYSTLVINVSGSFILGFVLIFISERVRVHANWRLFFAIGFLGAYTTFSTFSFENFALIQERSYVLALANMLGSVFLGLIAVVAGIIVARLL